MSLVFWCAVAIIVFAFIVFFFNSLGEKEEVVLTTKEKGELEDKKLEIKSERTFTQL